MALNVIEHRLLGINQNPLNPAAIMIIKKEGDKKSHTKNVFMCPSTKFPLYRIRKNLFSKRGLLVYPNIDGIDCLLEESAIVATHFDDQFDVKI